VIRKAAAAAIMATAAGCVAEMSLAGPLDPPRWWRAPVTGTAVLLAAGLLAWAQRELSGDREPRAG